MKYENDPALSAGSSIGSRFTGKMMQIPEAPITPGIPQKT